MTRTRTHAAALAAVTTILAGGAAFAASDSWRREAAPEDAQRLDRLSRAWSSGLAQAEAEDPAGLRKLGALADPKAGLDRPQPRPGDYQCRTIKLGGKGDLPGGLTVYGWFRCRVALTRGGDLNLAKITGSQRPIGSLYPDGPRRLVYLGAVAWGDEKGPVGYRRDPERDQVGVVERIGQNRWRLVMPFPKYESTLDLIELKR
jgi:hypothetical protein